MSRGPKGEKPSPAFKTKLGRLYPRQDAPTQLALDYSPEEDAGLTLASLAASFFGGLRKPDPLLGHPQPRFLVELPVHPDERTSSEPVRMSKTCRSRRADAIQELLDLVLEVSADI
jgi:hypothetical protein